MTKPNGHEDPRSLAEVMLSVQHKTEAVRRALMEMQMEAEALARKAAQMQVEMFGMNSYTPPARPVPTPHGARYEGSPPGGRRVVGPFRGDADEPGARANAQIHADMLRDGGAQ